MGNTADKSKPVLDETQRQALWEFEKTVPPRNYKGGDRTLHGSTCLDLSRQHLDGVHHGITLLSCLQKLYLSQNLLKRSPMQLSVLTTLTWLDLNQNSITELDDSISCLCNLVELDLNNNSLASLPAGLSVLTNLQQLYINHNNFLSFPTVIFSMVQLSTLNIFHNPLESLPNGISALTCLKNLFIELGGRIMLKRGPKALKSLPCWTNTKKPWKWMAMSIADALKYLHLFDKIYSSENLKDITHILEHIHTFESVDFSSNQIYALPEGITLCSKLKGLNLSKNDMSYFPSCLLMMTWLEELDLSHNHISILPDLRCMSALRTLDLRNNDFCMETQSFLNSLDLISDEFLFVSKQMDEVPYVLEFWPNQYKTISFYDNKLSVLPESLCAMDWIVSLDISQNLLTTLPQGLSKLTDLTYLNYSRNKTSFMPEQISHLTKLRELNLGYNNVSRLPKGISTLERLSNLQIQMNPINFLPQGVSLLKNLKEMCIEYHGFIFLERAPEDITALPCWNNASKFTGWGATMNYTDALKNLQLYEMIYASESIYDISQLMGDWLYLQSIDISMNQIHELPESFSTLLHLRKLNLRKNRITKFPGCLFLMTWLESLDISNNRIYCLQVE